MMESFFNIKNFKSRDKVMQSLSSIKNFKSHKKVMDSFFGIKTFKAVMVYFSVHFINTAGATFLLLAVVSIFPSYSCSKHFWKYGWKSPYVSNDCLWKLYL